MKVGEWSDEARMALRCILHRRFARIGEQLLRRGLQRFGQTEDDGEARVSMWLRKGRPTSTIRANFCFVIFACLRRRVTLRPRMTEASFLLSSAA